jgi:hypothetical protein
VQLYYQLGQRNHGTRNNLIPYLRNMDFGRVDPAQLDEIDFKLPAEPALNKTVLKGTPLKKAPRLPGMFQMGQKGMGWQDLP